MTAAQAIGAACLVEGSVARRALGGKPEPISSEGSIFEFHLAHVKGVFPVSIGTSAAGDKKSEALPAALFLQGKPTSGMYETSVLPLADGRAFV